MTGCGGSFMTTSGGESSGSGLGFGDASGDEEEDDDADDEDDASNDSAPHTPALPTPTLADVRATPSGTSSIIIPAIPNAIKAQQLRHQQKFGTHLMRMVLYSDPKNCDHIRALLDASRAFVSTAARTLITLDALWCSVVHGNGAVFDVLTAELALKEVPEVVHLSLSASLPLRWP